MFNSLVYYQPGYWFISGALSNSPIGIGKTNNLSFAETSQIFPLQFEVLTIGYANKNRSIS